MQTTEVVLTGEQKMQCAGCETRITYALRQLPGVREVRASAKTQRVRVMFDEAQGITGQQINEKLKQLGYIAEPVTPA